MFCAFFESRFQSRNGIALRDELMNDVARVPGFLNGAQNGGIVQFLIPIQIVSSGIARRMIVTDVVLGRADRVDDVALHDLHMVDVVE